MILPSSPVGRVAGFGGDVVHRCFAPAATCARRHIGPLAPYIDGIADALSQRGCARATARKHLVLVADVSQWLVRRRLGAVDLDERASREYLRQRRRRRANCRGNSEILQPLVEHLRERGVLGPRRMERPRSPGDRLARDFECYLIHERALAPATRINYLPFVRRFLAERFGTRAGRPMHESVETMQVYLHASMTMKQKAMSKAGTIATHPARYRPGDRLLSFLKSL